MLFRTVRARWSVTVSLLVFVLMTGAILAYAALPYAPGQTLDPTCHPGEPNCTVQVFTAVGDLRGSSTYQTVIALQGNPVASTTPTSSQVLQWNGSAWAPTTPSTTTNYWSPTSTGIYYNATGTVSVGNTLSVGSLAESHWYTPYANTTGILVNGPIRNDGTNMSVGTTLNPLVRWQVFRPLETQPAHNTAVEYLAASPQYTSTADLNFFVSRHNLTPIVTTGVTNNNWLIADWSVAMRNYVATDSDDNGTAGNMFGHMIEYGHFNYNTAARPITTNVYGLFLRPFNFYGTITNLYDVYGANDREPFGGTVTNHWGIYFPSTTAKHYLQGPLGIGVLPGSTYGLDALTEARFGPTVGSQTYTSGGSLNGSFGVDGVANFWINFFGYQNGTTQFRNFIIGDGKNGHIADFDGATKAVTLGGYTGTGTSFACFDSAGKLVRSDTACR